MELIYKYLWINSFPKPQNDGYFKYIRKIFQCIFEDKRAFVKFKNEVATNNLLSALPMSQDGYNDWFRLFCKLTLGTMKGINYNYNQLVEDYYKRVRTVKTIQLPYDIGFIGKPMKLTSQSFKIKINKDLEGTLIFKFIDSRVTRKPWNALTSCYEPQVIDCEQSYENNDLEDFCDEMGYDIQSGSEAWAEAKEEFGASFDYFNWDFKWHQSTEKLIEVPMVTVMGKTNLDFIATNYNYYILITDTVPSDINLQPKGRVKCYHMPHPIPELFYIFAYNLPHELNLPKWDYKSFGLMNNIRNNPKFNYYINEKLIQFGEDSTSFEKYFRYMGSMSTNNQNLQQRGMIEKSVLIDDAKSMKDSLKLGTFNDLMASFINDYAEEKITIGECLALLKSMDFNVTEEKLLNLKKMTKMLRDYYVEELKFKLNVTQIVHGAVNVAKKQKLIPVKKVLGQTLSDRLKTAFKSNYKTDQNDYNPIASDEILSKEVTILFKNHSGKLLNRDLKLLQAEKNEVRYLLTGLKNDFKESLATRPLDQIMNVRKYIMYIDFLLDMAQNSKVSTGDSDISLFKENFSELNEKLTGYESESSDEDVEYFQNEEETFIIENILG
jgi:hypothetical protein